MSFMTISTWDWSKITGDDAAVQARITENIGRLKAAGAENVFVARVAPDQAVAVTVYPDEATRDSVREMVLGIRESSGADFTVSVINEVAGEVLASV